MSATVLVGDCLEVMQGMESNSIDAPVTDPPYGLSFMGRDWDRGVPGAAYWTQVLRVTRPGAYLLAFGGTRTFHRLTCAIEDAGWEIQDCLSWLYGSGFPKHKSKLKPAWEPIVMARKPTPRATPLNIDACRIEGGPTVRNNHAEMGYGGGNLASRYTTGSNAGRWPANVVLDEDAAALIDEQSGLSVSRIGKRRSALSPGDGWGMTATGAEYSDSGGASRFFYCAKASRREREAGLDDAPRKAGGSNAKGFTEDVARGLDRNRPVANHHPTVKPVALMRWLVRLVTPPDGLVLDPFCGSGTTGIAALSEGRRFIGIELSNDYAEIARKRIAVNATLFSDGAA